MSPPRPAWRGSAYPARGPVGHPGSPHGDAYTGHRVLALCRRDRQSSGTARSTAVTRWGQAGMCHITPSAPVVLPNPASRREMRAPRGCCRPPLPSGWPARGMPPSPDGDSGACSIPLSPGTPALGTGLTGVLDQPWCLAGGGCSGAQHPPPGGHRLAGGQSRGDKPGEGEELRWGQDGGVPTQGSKPQDGVIDLPLPPSPKMEVKHQTRLKAVHKRARFG